MRLLLSLLLTLTTTTTHAWTQVYENDDEGDAVSGSLSDLRDAVAAGKNIKVSITNAAGHAEMFEFERVIVGSNGHVYGVTPLRLANFTLSGDSPSFSYYSNEGVAVFGTHGTEVVKVNTATYFNPLDMKWFVE